MRILYYENDDDLKILRAPNTPVNKDEDLSSVLKEMFLLMHKARGVGLAAPQVGINKRFFIVEIEKGQPLVFINPQIIETSVQMIQTEEGCLSLAGLYERVQRHAAIKMQATDANGKLFTIEAEGFMAVCLQHEYDHLEGKLFIDHLDSAKIEGVLKKYQKIVTKRVKK